MPNQEIRTEEENARTAAYEAAIGVVVERLEELRHRRAFGRVEIHLARGRIQMVRTVEDERIP